MEAVPAEDLFAADPMFATSLGSMYGLDFSTGTDLGMAPFEPDSESIPGGLPATVFNTDALLAMFDCSLAAFFETYPSIDDAHVRGLADDAGGSDDMPLDGSLLPDYRFVDLLAAGTVPGAPERNEDSKVPSPPSQMSLFEDFNSTPDSEISQTLSMPWMTDAELGHPTLKLHEQSVSVSIPEMLRFDRRPSQDPQPKGTTSSAQEPKVSSIHDQCM